VVFDLKDGSGAAKAQRSWLSPYIANPSARSRKMGRDARCDGVTAVTDLPFGLSASCKLQLHHEPKRVTRY